MALPKDDFSEAYAQQMALAEQCFTFGASALERMLMAQIDASRQLFELQSRQFSAMEDSAGEAPALQWVAFCRRAVAGGTEASEVWLRTLASMQAETTRLMEEFFPVINRSVMGSMEHATEALAVAASKAEATRKRAA
jgi:hypothetical protein